MSAISRLALYEAISDLTPDAVSVIEDRFGLHGRRPRSQEEIAEARGTTQQAVAGIEQRALARLRRRLGAELV